MSLEETEVEGVDWSEYSFFVFIFVVRYRMHALARETDRQREEKMRNHPQGG